MGPRKPEGVALCRELGLGDRLVPTNPDLKSVYVLHRRKLHPLPEGMLLAVPTKLLPFARSGLFSWPGKLRMGLDLVLPGRNGSADESIASFLRRRFGQEAVERLGEPLLAGIHAGDPERLSILATFPRFREIEKKHGSLVRGMWATHRPQPTAEARPTAAFYSLRGGLREMVDALVVSLDRAKVKTKAEVRSISRSASGFSVVTAQGGKGEREMTEGIQQGAIDLLVTSTGPLGGFSPSINILDFPFLFRDFNHVDSVLDGAIGRKLLDDFEKAQIKALSFWENGFRHLTNSKIAVKKVEDAKGLKIRTMENKIHLSAWKDAGLNPTPMSWGEVFTALQQKVIDGQENPIAVIYSNKLWDAGQKFFSFSAHV